MRISSRARHAQPAATRTTFRTGLTAALLPVCLAVPAVGATAFTAPAAAVKAPAVVGIAGPNGVMVDAPTSGGVVSVRKISHAATRSAASPEPPTSTGRQCAHRLRRWPARSGATLDHCMCMHSRTTAPIQGLS